MQRWGRALVLGGLATITVALVGIDLLLPRLEGHVGLSRVLARFFGALAAIDGYHATAPSTSLRTTIGLVVVALLLGLAGLVRRVRTPGARVTPSAPAREPEPDPPRG